SGIFERLESLKRTAHNLKSGEQGLVRVAAIPAVCHKLLPDVLARFHRAHPNVSCEVHTLHKRQIAAELLSSLPMVSLTDDDPLYMAFLRYCEHQGFRPTGRIQVQTSQLAEEL